MTESGSAGVYLTMLEREDACWNVFLRVIPATGREGRLRFLFRRLGATEVDPAYSWETPAGTLDELTDPDHGISNAFLLRQLDRAIAEERAAQPG